MSTPIQDGAAQMRWAKTLLNAFATAGVRDVVISPGSRSTPFVLAASDHPQLRCHDVTDERAAAYFALGQARVTGRPSLLLCTSGTAVANYLPAVVEAGMAYVPVLVLSADRPVELAHCGANQTIDQLKIFGHHARRFFDLGLWDVSPRVLRALRRTVAQGVFATTYPIPGAVHLNARARKPLEPIGDPPSPSDAPTGDAVAQAQPRAPRRLVEEADLDRLAERMAQVDRGLLVAGPASLVSAETGKASFLRLAQQSGFVTFADPASPWRFCGHAEGVVKVDAYDSLLHSAAFRHRRRPDLILQVGRTLTSGAFDRYLDEMADVEHWVIDPHGWQDPQSTADHLLFGDLEPTLEALRERLAATQTSVDRSWSEAWQQADRLAWSMIDEELSSDASEDSPLSEGAVARGAVEALDSGSLLVLGNSLPIRHVDIYCPGGAKALQVVSQRGTSGIDGVVSGALGAAQQAAVPSLLLVGDVSFLHDVSGLATARLVATPMVVVVVQNQGGRIFEQLPVHGYLAKGESTERGPGDSPLNHWLTPHTSDLQHAAALYDLPFSRVATRDALRVALEEGLTRRGVTVIEAVVPPHGAAEQNGRVRRAVQAVLEEADLT